MNSLAHFLPICLLSSLQNSQPPADYNLVFLNFTNRWCLYIPFDPSSSTEQHALSVHLCCCINDFYIKICMHFYTLVPGTSAACQIPPPRHFKCISAPNSRKPHTRSIFQMSKLRLRETRATASAVGVGTVQSNWRLCHCCQFAAATGNPSVTRLKDKECFPEICVWELHLHCSPMVPGRGC